MTNRDLHFNQPNNYFLFQFLRFSSKFSNITSIRKFYDAVNDRVCRLSSYACLQVALLGVRGNFCHQNSVEETVRRFADDFTSLRLKDLAEICFLVGRFDYKSDSKIEDKFCQNILIELKNRVSQIMKSPKCLPQCLHSLTLKGHYDEEAISVVLGKQFLKFAYGTNPIYGSDVFHLDAYARINLKDTYQGNLLTEKSRMLLGKILTEYIPVRNGKWHLRELDIMLLELQEASEEMYIHSYLAHPLPHYGPSGKCHIYIYIISSEIYRFDIFIITV